MFLSAKRSNKRNKTHTMRTQKQHNKAKNKNQISKELPHISAIIQSKNSAYYLLVNFHRSEHKVDKIIETIAVDVQAPHLAPCEEGIRVNIHFPNISTLTNELIKTSLRTLEPFIEIQKEAALTG